MESWTCSVLVRVMKFHSSSYHGSPGHFTGNNELNARGLNDTNCLGCCCCRWWSLWVWGVKIRTVAVTSVRAGLRFEKGLPRRVCWCNAQTKEYKNLPAADAMESLGGTIRDGKLSSSYWIESLCSYSTLFECHYYPEKPIIAFFMGTGQSVIPSPGQFIKRTIFLFVLLTSCVHRNVLANTLQFIIIFSCPGWRMGVH